ncbi:MAG: hypothetical protein H6815_05015 [Phycisphaeraceae bacterium]|nr:hypothetical protein [Phycisphaerales bacterium]MCB9859796.1 hypothetical protein [Phycisphaeraceae bacterium]
MKRALHTRLAPICTALGVCVLVACNGTGRVTPTSTNVAASTMDARQRAGLDTMWWRVREWNDGAPAGQSSSQVAATLAPFLLTNENVSDPAIVDVLETWRANGLYVSLVPGEQLGGVLRALTPIGQIDRLVVEPSSTWSAIGPERAYPDDTPIMLDNGPLRLPRGALRLLLRGWPEAVGVDVSAGLRAAIHIELVPQAVDSQLLERIRKPALTEQKVQEHAAIRRNPDRQGQVFSRLKLEALVKPGHALLITADSTLAYWPGPEDLADAASAMEASSEDEPEELTPEEIEAKKLGPRVVPWPEGVDAPTIGQRMLNERIEHRLAPGADPSEVFGEIPGLDRLRAVERGIILIAPTGMELFNRR